MKDPFSDILLKLLGFAGVKDTKRNRRMVFAFLYNFIPAFIFAPYLLYAGLKNSLSGLVVISILLCVVDSMHLVMSIVKNRK